LVYDDDGVVVFNFGKYMGQPVKEVLAKDPGYFGWMMQGDFPRYTKRVLQRVKEGAS
jgi:DNA polymerase-3 subunit epsilon